jgi:hypothetical protein
MAIPTISLTDASDNVYTFPEDFWLIDESVESTQNIVNRTYASGGKNIADGYLQARNIVLEGALRADTLSELETKRRAFVRACLKGGQLQISDDPVSRYIGVEAPLFTITQGDYRNEIAITVIFVAEDPFWRDVSLTTVEQVVTGDDTISVDNTGSDFIISMIIEVENDQSVDNPGIKFTNPNDGGMSLTYNDSNFIDGDLLVINNQEGTVKRNNNNTIENLVTPARFLRLQPVVNNLEYEGAAATIRVKFRKAYL